MASPTPGLLYVTMQPNANLTLAQFHEWYNNEHGPTRLRLPFIGNGLRYRAADYDISGKDMPEWLAIYDIADMNELTKDTYTRLRTDAVKSDREKSVMREIAINRKLFDLVSENHSSEFRPPSEISEHPERCVLHAVTTIPLDGKEDELREWLSKEQKEKITCVPGWRRSRYYVTSPLLEGMHIEFLETHEFAAQDRFGDSKSYQKVLSFFSEENYGEVAKERSMQHFELFYVFGPAPRDLTSLFDSSTINYTARDGLTKTFSKGNGAGAAIESYITVDSDISLSYRLEGSADADAPLIILSNSVLVEWGIWDDFVTSFLSDFRNQKYRILRYHTRGRTSQVGPGPITLDTLSKDITAMLDALRVRNAILIGVSLGGATVLNTALKYPKRVNAFISCDTNAKSPDGNKKTWEERISIAEKQRTVNEDGEVIVGDQLAEMTVRRWFVKESYDGAVLERKISRVKKMVESNNLEGFRKGVEALFAYNMEHDMKKSKIPGAFVVGSGDGFLPGTMKKMAQEYGDGGGQYKSIEAAGHLPMVEKPAHFASFVTEFLQRSN